MTIFYINNFMKNYIFDTSFLVSLLDIDDINHEKSLEMISNLEIWNKMNNFYINEVILNEVYTVLNYKKWFQFLNKFESFLDEIQIIYLTWNNDEYISFFKLLWLKISVADSTVIYDSIKYSLKIFTFDKEMIKIFNKISKN